MKNTREARVIVYSLILSIILSLFFVFTSYGQDSSRVIKDTTIKGITYKLYVGSKGGKYIVVTSKTGTTYKKYFPKK